MRLFFFMTQSEQHLKKLAAIGLEDYDIEHITSFSFPPKEVYATTKHIATSSIDKTVRIWNVETEVVSATLQHDNEVSDVLFAPDGKSVASITADRKVHLWREVSVSSYVPVPLQEARARAVAFAPPLGKYLASVPVNNETEIYFWSADSGALVRTVNMREIAKHEAVFKELAFSSDGHYFATICKDDFENFDYRTRKFAPMSERIVLFETETGRTLELADSVATVGNRNEVYFENLTFSPTTTMLAASAGSAIFLWDVANGNEQKFGELEESYANRLLFSPRGEYLACTKHDSHVHIWHVERRELVLSVELVGSVAAFSPNGKYFALISHGVALEIMHAMASGPRVDADWSSAERMRRFPPAPGNAVSQINLDRIAFTPDSRKVVLFKKNELLRFVNPVDFRDLTNKTIALLPLHWPPYVTLKVLNRELTEVHRNQFQNPSSEKLFLKHETEFYHFEKISAVEAVQKSFKAVVKARDQTANKKRF